MTLAGDTPRDTATLVTVYGRSIHATRQLRRLDNLHALIGADSKEMDNDATEQHRRAMDDQHIDDSAPHGRLYAAEADGGSQRRAARCGGRRGTTRDTIRVRHRVRRRILIRLRREALRRARRSLI